MNNNQNTDFLHSSTFKGVVAVLGTLLAVVIVIMIAAKVLFISDDSDSIKKTGRITSTEAKVVATTTTPRTTKKPVKKTSRDYKDYDEPEYDIDTDEYKIQTVISAVYLHPKPTSSSENLCVLPVGAECKVFANENGWLYLEYDGQKGYAYYTFFTQ
ncbi:MAG: hypothetical protein Q4D35_00330 [Ruminococcus sp.]|nr:hypothetical protein [Ruminococcus sp.]